MLQGEDRQLFESLHSQGMMAKDSANDSLALEKFNEADQLAIAHGDDRKRLDALQPGARALWTLGRYGEAEEKLETASDIASELGLTDEEGIILSNLGRVASVNVLRTVPLNEQKRRLRAESMPKFIQAFDRLKGSRHFYYRFANAEHGSVIAALARRRITASRLILDGLIVAFRKSPDHYDQVRTYKISKDGLKALGGAAILLPLGNRTPVLADKVRSRIT